MSETTSQAQQQAAILREMIHLAEQMQSWNVTSPRLSALADGASALESPPSPAPARSVEEAQDVEQKVYHAYEAARRLQANHLNTDYAERLRTWPADFDTVLAGLHAARRFIFNSYQLPPQNQQNWAGLPDLRAVQSSAPSPSPRVMEEPSYQEEP